MNKKMDRRDFIKIGGVITAGTAVGYGLPLYYKSKVAHGSSGKIEPSSQYRWGMVIDVSKCVEGCSACTDACRKENNVAFHNDETIDVHWIRKASIKRKVPNARAFSIPLLCNHCDRPPCALVCPVAATYRRKDGIVIVDKHRCIGCRYCLVACPYNMRMFNFKENHVWHNKDFPKRMHGVSESCHFCYHRLDKDKDALPACVEACKNANANAMTFGNLNNPTSEASMLVANNMVKALREDLGTRPKVYYIGL